MDAKYELLSRHHCICDAPRNASGNSAEVPVQSLVD